MPRVPLDSLPGESRVWVFGSEHPVTDTSAQWLLDIVDAFLDQWAAHGAPLRAGRDWREHRFLTIAVDQSTAGASGCSIDALFRALRESEDLLGTTMIGSGRVYYRNSDGSVASATRDLFSTLGATGAVGPETPVFDTTVQTLADWNERFETPLGASWHARLLPEGAGSERTGR
ncbi:MAG TPA: hypothetical protein VMM18_16995 [Gemmatimonadaceae bacterium]|nr:hypothetical protein [Gemmatimonadaceae bacterium]